MSYDYYSFNIIIQSKYSLNFVTRDYFDYQLRLVITLIFHFHFLLLILFF